MMRITPAQYLTHPRVALAGRHPLKGATPADQPSWIRGVLAAVASRLAFWTKQLAPISAASLALALVACSSTPPPPEWQMNAKGSVERAADAWLSGNSKIEAVEFARARSEVARTGRPDLLARVELLHCATRVAALDFEPCAGYEALAADAAAAEQAYARYLAGTALPADAALLPEAHRGLAGGSASPDGALAGIQDPLSRLVAAGVLLRRGQATPGVITQAVDTASAQGWRRPLLAWLKVEQQRARAGGAADEVARIQRRIDLVLEHER
jgi:hypothetical protein